MNYKILIYQKFMFKKKIRLKILLRDRIINFKILQGYFINYHERIGVKK